MNLCRLKSPALRSQLAAIALVAAAIIVGGCSRVDVHSDKVRGVAYVRVDDVIKHHPLYPQLVQLEYAMTAINLTASIPHAPLSPAEIDAQTKDLNRQLQDLETRTQKIIAQKQQQYSEQERQADIAALRAANIDPAAAGIGAAMSATSQAQAQQAAQAARQDYQQYQQSVVAEDRAAMNAVAKQLSEQANQKFRARAEQYQQEENDLSLRLAQQDAPQVLALKTKANNLAMDPDTRKSVLSQLNAIGKRENDQVAALRAVHARDLAAYQKQLGAQTNAQIQSQMSSIRSQTQAKLSERQQQVGAQLRGLGGAPVPTVSIPPDVQQKLAAIHQELTAKYQADAQATVDEYNNTKADLDRQFAALHGEDVGATGAAARQLIRLQKRHDDLLAQIQSQIQSEANKLAKEMGFTIVFDNVKAAPGGYDLTNDLIHDVESLHE
jgi:hypothetical protein